MDFSREILRISSKIGNQHIFLIWIFIDFAHDLIKATNPISSQPILIAFLKPLVLTNKYYIIKLIECSAPILSAQHECPALNLSA